MSSSCLLIASEFALHRESLSSVLEVLRPEMRICTVAPDDMEDSLHRNRPWLVICSRLTSAIEQLTPAWIVLHPDNATYTTVNVAGERATIPHPSPTMDELLAIIDKAWTAELGNGSSRL